MRESPCENTAGKPTFPDIFQSSCVKTTDVFTVKDSPKHLWTRVCSPFKVFNWFLQSIIANAFNFMASATTGYLNITNSSFWNFDFYFSLINNAFSEPLHRPTSVWVFQAEWVGRVRHRRRKSGVIDLWRFFACPVHRLVAVDTSAFGQRESGRDPAFLKGADWGDTQGRGREGEGKVGVKVDDKFWDATWVHVEPPRIKAAKEKPEKRWGGTSQ